MMRIRVPGSSTACSAPGMPTSANPLQSPPCHNTKPDQLLGRAIEVTTGLAAAALAIAPGPVPARG